MLGSNSEIHKLISRGNRKIFDLYKEMGANLFTTFEDYNISANLLFSVFLCESPDFYYELESITREPYSKNERDSGFYEILLNSNRVSKKLSDGHKHIESLFELCTHTKNAWNLKEVIKLYEEAESLGISIREEQKFDRIKLLNFMAENLYSYYLGPLWCLEKYQTYDDFTRQKNIETYEKNIKEYIEYMFFLIKPTLEELADSEVKEGYRTTPNKLRSLISIDYEVDYLMITNFICDYYNITIDHEIFVQNFPELGLSMQLMFLEAGMDINNPLIIKNENKTLKEIMNDKLNEMIDAENTYSDTKQEEKEKRIKLENLLLKSDVSYKEQKSKNSHRI